MVEFDYRILLGLVIGIAVCLITYFIIEGFSKSDKAKEISSEDADIDWREFGHEK